MYRNHLKVAWRNLRRHPGYTTLIIAGLAVGIASFLLISIAMQHELSYDRFHPDAERLYRVVQDVSWGEGSTWDWTTPVMCPALAADFPEIEAFARYHTINELVSYEEDRAPTPG